MNALDVISGALVVAGAAIRLRGDDDVGMLILTLLFTVTTAPVVAHRVGQLANREQNLRDSLTIDEMAPESPQHTEREQDSGHGTD